MIRPQTAVCSICSDPLWGREVEEKAIASTDCGHVFHELCILGWVGMKSDPNCPICRKILPRHQPFHKIYIDQNDDPDYLGIITENERIQNQIPVTKNNAQEIVTGLLSKLDHLEKLSGSFKWNDFATTLQTKILDKLRDSGCVGVLLEVECALPSITAHRHPNILLRLITSGDKIEPDICDVVAELYFQKKAKLQRTVTLNDVIQSSRNNLLSKLRLTSGIQELEANQVPLTAKTLSRLVQGKDSALLGEIISAYVDEMVNGSVCLMNDLCCVTLLELVKDVVDGKLKVFQADAFDRLQEMVQLGLLKESRTLQEWEFVCDTVRNYFIGVVMLISISRKGISRVDASRLLVKNWPLVYSFLNYLTDMSCAVSKSSKLTCPWNLKFDDTIFSDLLITLAVGKLKFINGSQEWLRKFFNNFPARNLHEIEYPFECNEGSLGFTLLHAAVISGSMQALLCILNEFDLSDPKFNNLIHFIVRKTSGKEEAEIKERREMISELLYKCIPMPDIPTLFPRQFSSTRIHADLIKFMIEKGLDPYEKNEKGDTLLHSVSKYKNAVEFHDLVGWLVENGHSGLLLEVSGRSKMTALHIAISKMDVKRETVELFLKAGVSLNKPDSMRRTIMYYAVMGGRGANLLSMLVELGADYETIDEEGNSGVHIAAQFSNLEALRYFGEQRVDIHKKNNAGETALLRTLRVDSKNLDEVIKVLVEMGADVNARDENGNTVLWLAMNLNKGGALKNHTIQLLKGRGAMEILPKPVIKEARLLLKPHYRFKQY